MNYDLIGFKCGIEIHNRLTTKHKLFCNCPPKFSEQKPVKIIKRKLRPVAGEMGKVDIAATYEYLKGKTFNYQVFSDTSCLVECDEEPPHELNSEALTIALQICKLLRAKIPEEIHIMRKTVIDGSNTSGFQRTALVGTNGTLDTSKGPVRIANICLEEESCGIVEKNDTIITYRLDRLGIPLIEIGTEPDIKDPEHAKEVAEKLGMIVRSTGKSQRGIGVIRQDINVSVKGGKRVEIKGFQDLDMIPKVIDFEINRQVGLVKHNQSKEETRLAKPDGSTDYMRPLPGGERMYPETDVPPIVITKEFLSSIKTPETWELKLERLEKILPKDLANQVLKSEYLDLFEKYYKTNPILIATTFTSTLKDLSRRGFETSNLKEEHFNELFRKNLPKEAIMTTLENLCKNPDAKIESDVISDETLHNIVKDVIDRNPELVKENKISALMGDVMKQVKGRVDGKKVMELLKKELR
ncbi:MAG: Glu-tRNA(Gln) amidotransferase subunit GatE [Nanoarchaeota archaeon]|nr:Glu-tRNA(Gln) amidotransferase subunit GatE [Nanoarchaeota archaeon]MBU4124123.1 Glu-tRNA(Gln) amidotransferase subunit GatE [Nanoarchaeota archaeon]